MFSIPPIIITVSILTDVIYSDIFINVQLHDSDTIGVYAVGHTVGQMPMTSFTITRVDRYCYSLQIFFIFPPVIYRLAVRSDS